MSNKAYSILYFYVKYAIKRNIPIMIILIVIFGILHFGIGSTAKENIYAIKVTDEDNTNLSKEFIEYLEEERQFKIDDKAINQLIIPIGFEKNFYSSNTTLDIGLIGVASEDIYEFQLYKLNDRNRIISKIKTSLSFELVVLLLLGTIISQFTNSFLADRRLGTIHFINNYINYWIYFLFSFLFGLLVIITLIISSNLYKLVVLLPVLFLINVILIYRTRKNPKIADNIYFINYGFIGLLIVLKVMGKTYLPIIDLLSKEYSLIFIVDIIILLILFLVVYNIKLTE